MEIQSKSAKQQNISRRVCNLSAEELQKKRGIDRANQKHYREKNKAYVRSLEEQVAKLTSRIQDLEAQIASYQQKNDHDLPNTNGSKAVAEDSLNRSSVLPSTLHELTVYSSSQIWDLGKISTPRLGESPPILPSLDDLPLDFEIDATVVPPNSAQECEYVDLGLFEALQGTNLPSGEFLMRSFTNLKELQAHGQLLEQADAPNWKSVPLNLPPTTKLDELILQTTVSWRSQALKFGKQHDELSEPNFPNISSLLTQFDEGKQGTMPLSIMIAAHVHLSPVQSLVERIAYMYNLALLIRWLVCRSKESYERIPDYMKPTKLQLTVPHPAWVDSVIWPEVRDEIIQRQNWEIFEDFKKVTGRSMTVRWPYTDSGAFVESLEDQVLMLSPIFEAHIRRVENWTISREAVEAFPFLKRYCA